MNIAKPPGGFEIRYSDIAKSQKESLCENVDDRRIFEGFLERLREVGHREGMPLDNCDDTGNRGQSMLAPGGIIAVVFRPLGDHIRIQSIQKFSV